MSYWIWAMLLGLFAGAVGRALVPNDAFQKMKGPRSWVVSLVLGLLGALVGFAIFKIGLGWGDDDVFDWGGAAGAIIGSVIVVFVASLFIKPKRR